MRQAVCPGSFDPPTYGHLDVIARAAALFDQVTVGVLVNDSKRGLFGLEERLEMLTAATARHPNVAVESFTGLLVDFCAAHGDAAIVKGLRAATDFDYELRMAQMNRTIAAVETVFVPASPQWSFVSSSLVKEVAALGGDVSTLVPPEVLDRLGRRLPQQGRPS